VPERIAIGRERFDRSGARQPSQQVLQLGHTSTQLIQLAAHVFIHAFDVRSAWITSQVRPSPGA
jgi:hypothetical protein